MNKCFFLTEDHFLKHTLLHISNVEKIAIDMLRNLINAPAFNNLEKLKKLEPKLQKMIKIHDMSKTTSSHSFLKKYNIKKPLYKELFLYAGKTMSNLDQNLINFVNHIDRLETLKLASKIGFTKWELDMYLKIEQYSDLVERGCNPITKIEMNKDIKKASDFITNASKFDISLIKKSEKCYNQVISTGQLFCCSI